MSRAAAITRRSADGELSPKDLDELISATSDAQGDLESLDQIMNFADNTFRQVP
jgi:hypothetical protein